MATITIEIPNHIKSKYGITNNISFENLIVKTMGKDFFSPDLEFTSYEDMSENHKKEFNKIDKVDKSKLLNI